MKWKVRIGIVFVVGCVFLWGSWEWFVNRTYVPEGQSMMLRYKGPLPLMFWSSNKQAKPGYFAEEGEIGILKTLRGPGRHFYNPIFYERTYVDDVIIDTGEVGIVTCKLGESLPDGEFLVDGDIGNSLNKGVLRKVLHPGKFRINPYAYTVKTVKTETTQSGKQIKHSGWVVIPTGYVGVVTNLTNNPLTEQKAGIQDNVLPPGIYPINGREQQIDVVEIGYRETTISTEKVYENNEVKSDEAGEPVIANNESGIEFPSSDGFPIHMDYTAIWGVMPAQAPHAVATFGNVKEVENKVVYPQIESICRNNGSEYKAVQLLVGKEREVYQKKTLEEFQNVLKNKEIELLYGLVRHIYIPKEVRQPIQNAFIADEETLTAKQEQSTAKSKALLEEATAKIDFAGRKVEVDTEIQVEKKLAEGNREAETIRAETRKMVAAIEKETAKVKAEAVEVLGKAENDGKRFVEEAKAARFGLAVNAFGTPQSYNNWIFASGLPENIDLKLLYAGDGTLWTDTKNLGIIMDKSKKSSSASSK